MTKDTSFNTTGFNYGSGRDMNVEHRSEVVNSHFEIVEGYARLFARPEVRLRFLKNTLALQASCGDRLSKSLGRWKKFRNSKLYDRLLAFSLYGVIFREIGKLLPSDSGGRRGLLRLHTEAPLSSRVFFRCYQVRHALCVIALVAGVGVIAEGYRAAAWSVVSANSYLAGRYKSVQKIYAVDAASQQGAVAGSLPSYQPEKIWLVEQGDGFERYSNGVRIISSLAVENRPRHFYAFKPGGTEAVGGPQSSPVGIVYHTSESDLLPFVEGNSDSIESRSKNLLDYVRKNKSYNYLIDRFGQVYRVVPDGDTAFHAGNSVWSDGRVTYVGLNESFIGVCFETKADVGKGGEQLTEAQVLAGRLLTQVLRSRYQLDDANCVTHGLVSVNPSNERICFHHDWAHGFPFEAMGLSDKYKVPPASVAELGFTYDDDIVEQVGGRLWPGVAAAEGVFAKRAAESQAKREELRDRMRSVYRERMELQSALQPGAREQEDSSKEAGR
jgi:hypothetical protein